MLKKSRQNFEKNFEKILRTKRAFKMKEKASFIIFEGLSLKQINKVFLEGESPTLIKFQAACNFIKKRLCHRCFSVNFVKFLKRAFFIERLWLFLWFVDVGYY